MHYFNVLNFLMRPVWLLIGNFYDNCLSERKIFNKFLGPKKSDKLFVNELFTNDFTIKMLSL